MQIKKNISNTHFLFGDFDRDGVKNIDDPKPMDKRRKFTPTIYQNPGYYSESQFLDADVNLSDVLLATKKYNDARRPFMQKFMRQNPTSYGRVKSVPSTLSKLQRKHQYKLKDLVAVTVPTPTRRDAYVVAKQIKRRYRTNPRAYDDYYKKPKGNVHYALHVQLLGNQPKKPQDIVQMEVQVKSKQMAILDKLMHPYYKRGKIPLRFNRISKELFMKGY